MERDDHFCSYLLEVRSETIHHFSNFMAQLVCVHVDLEKVGELAIHGQPVVLNNSFPVLSEDLEAKLLLCCR